MFKHASIILATAMGIIAAGGALAHAKLLSSSPAANAQLADAPKTLTLNFSEAAQLALLKLTVGGQSVPVSIDRGAKAAASVTVALPALAPGMYQVQWSALAADDGHVTKGSFSFSILSSKAT